MSKKKIKKNLQECEDVEFEDNTSQIPESINIDNNTAVELCQILCIKDKSMVINFKGHGINITTHGVIDRDSLPEYIYVKYKKNIGDEDFEYYPIFG